MKLLREFIMDDYDIKKPFSSFLPGIAGIKGIPLWTYYANRGQGITSVGSKDKNGAIIEFNLPLSNNLLSSLMQTVFLLPRAVSLNGTTNITEPFLNFTSIVLAFTTIFSTSRAKFSYLSTNGLIFFSIIIPAWFLLSATITISELG